MFAKLHMVTGGLLGLSSVLLGAFGAHGLRNLVSAASISSWQTGVSYQMFHALALLIIGLWLRQGGAKLLNWAAILFCLGVLTFSGSIYLLVLFQISWIGPITPLGGLLLIAGWLCLCLAALKLDETTDAARQKSRDRR